MPYGLYISAAGADAQSRRMEVLSNNLANVDTVGFKRELAIAQARYSEAIERGEDIAGSRTRNDLGGGVFTAETMTDFAGGPLKRTGIDSDLAIDGDGFFRVERDGQEFLTRAGNFRFSTDGRLTTQQGYSVLDDSGVPITIDSNLPYAFLPGGAIQQGGERKLIGLVRPQSMGDLVKVGETLFSPLSPPLPVDAGQRHVASGFLEHSTVAPTSEMMELIETSRAYEANVRMIQNHDSVIGALVNRLLRQA